MNKEKQRRLGVAVFAGLTILAPVVASGFVETPVDNKKTSVVQSVDEPPKTPLLVQTPESVPAATPTHSYFSKPKTFK